MVRKANIKSPSTNKTNRRFIFKNRSGRFAALIILTVLATALLAISNSSANSEKPGTKAQDAGTSASLPPQLVKPESDQSLSVQPSTTQSQVDPDAIQQTRPVPVLTMQNAPEVPVCREI